MRKVIKGGDVNFSSYPDTFSSSEGQVPGVGCAGTKNNALAAAGKFSQNGGYYSFGQPIGSPIRASGTGMVQVNDHPTVVRPMNVFSKRFSGLAGGKQILVRKRVVRNTEKAPIGARRLNTVALANAVAHANTLAVALANTLAVANANTLAVALANAVANIGV